MQESRDQAQGFLDIAADGATPDEIQEAMAEVLQANAGNQFWEKFLQPAPAIEY